MKLSDMSRINERLHEEIEDLKSECFRIKRRCNDALRKDREKEIDTTIFIKDSTCDGLCHADIISESFYDLNPSTCRTWLEFDTFDEAKLHVKACFGVEST